MLTASARAPILNDGNREIIGSSPRIRRVLHLADKASRGNWPALILGESGTGKELIARRIHEANPNAPFVTIDCSSISGPLLESELFGHVKGSFTGASTTKIGLIELAHGGTAFFDEIGELPLDLQSKLLRVLQEKEFRPLGSLTVKKSSFRIVAATNRDLKQEVEKGRFRQDLYYRLCVVPLRLPPLRERKEDIPPLTQYFFRRYCPTLTISSEAIERLQAHDWPGNVRELENCIQQLAALHSGPIVHSMDLPTRVLPNGQVAIVPTPSTAADGGSAAPAITAFSGRILPLAEVEKQAILQALQYTKGDRMAASQMLEIGRTTLYRKLKEYGFND